MADTIIKQCEVCENDFDYLPNTGKDKICDECLERSPMLGDDWEINQSDNN